MLRPDVRLRQVQEREDGDIGVFLAECRAVDQEVTEYAVKLVKERFAEAQAKATLIDSCTTWDCFTFGLGCSIGPFLVQEPSAGWVKQLFVDLYRFCELNPSGSPAYRFALILSHLGASNRVRSFGLPPAVEECYRFVGDWAEEQALRDSQQGY